MIRFETLSEELAAFELMSEEEAIKLYNVDYKEEAMDYIVDWYKMMNLI